MLSLFIKGQNLAKRELCIRRWYSFIGRKDNKAIKESLSILNLSEDEATAQKIKERYVELVKEHHPDRTGNANTAEFYVVQRAYETLMEYISQVQDGETEGNGKEYDIQHTAPQHRRYLEFYDGHSGTPSQRAKEHQQRHLRRAAEAVAEFRTNKTIASTGDVSELVDSSFSQRHKATQAIERLVEDLIQESMRRGEFDNLKGSGKPLKQKEPNPYVDTMTQKLNEVIINNGFAPEWIQLQREIRETRTQIRAKMASAWEQSAPEVQEDFRSRIAGDAELVDHVRGLNKAIDKYNMLVPVLNSQQMHFILEREIQKVMETPRKPPEQQKLKSAPRANQNEGINLFDVIFKAFQRN